MNPLHCNIGSAEDSKEGWEAGISYLFSFWETIIQWNISMAVEGTEYMCVGPSIQ